MIIKRVAIESLREKLRERDADSNYSNQFLFNILVEHAKWLIKREISKGNIYKNTALFQTFRCVDVIESSTIDKCCPIKTKCTIFRTKNKLPDIWLEDAGPIIKGVTSVDNSSDFWVTTPTTWQNKRENPYQKMSKQMHSFYSDGYMWFPENNPHKVNINAFWVDDVSTLNECEDNGCVRYLDTRFMIPDWLEAEMYAKALEQVAGVTKRLPEDNIINKNPTRRD